MDTWTNIWDMFVDIRLHAKANGRAVVKEDLPEKLLFGWRCTMTGKTWFIHAVHIKRHYKEFNSDLPSNTREMYSDSLSSPEGAAAFLDMLNGLD